MRKFLFVSLSLVFLYRPMYAQIIDTLALLKEKAPLSQPLAFITTNNALKLVYQNDKCGEFGGDRKIIVIHRKVGESQLYADYFLETMNCDKLEEGKKKKLSIEGILLSDEDGKLIIESVKELLTSKLLTEAEPWHSGLYREVLSSDSSLAIHDFPAAKWKAFERLSERLSKK